MATEADVLLKLQADVNSAVRDLGLAETAVDDVGAALRMLGEAEVEVDTVKAENGLKQLREALARIPPELRDVGGEFDRLDKEINDAEKRLKRFNVATKKSSAASKRLAGALSGAKIAAANFIANLGADAVRAFAQATLSAVKSAFQFKLSMDGLAPALGTVTSSLADAEAAQNLLDSQSRRLGVSIKELQAPFIGLLAPLQGTNLEGEATRDLFVSITEAGTALGRSQEQVGRAITAVGQIASKGVVSLEEWRRQFAEAIPGAGLQTAKALAEVREGFDGTVGSLNALIASGKLTAEEFLPSLTKGLEDLAGTAVDERIEKLGPTIGRMGVAAQATGKAFIDEMEPGLKAILTAIQGNIVSADAWAVALGQVADEGLKTIASLIDAATEFQGNFAELTAATRGWREEIVAVADQIPVFGTVIKALDGVVDSLEGVNGEASRAFGEIETSAVLAAQGITDSTSEAAGQAAQSFAGLSGAAKASFSEITKEVEISAGARKEIEQDLAGAIAAIDDERFKERKAAESLLLKAAQDGADSREDVERLFQDRMVELAAAAREKILEATKKAELDAERVGSDREKIEAALQGRITAITEKAVEDRAEVEALRVAAEQRNADDIVTLRAAAEDLITERTRRGIEERARAVEEQVAAARRAAAEEAKAATETEALIERVGAKAREAANDRVAAQREALGAIAAAETTSADGAIAAFERISSGARLSAEARRRIQEGLVAELARLEDDVATKRAAAEDRFREKLVAGKDEQVALEQELQDKLTEIEVSASERRGDLAEKRIEQAKAVADKEIAEAKRVQEERKKINESIVSDFAEFTENINALISGGDEGGFAEAAVAEVERFRTAVGGLAVDKEALGLEPLSVGDLGQFAEALFAAQELGRGLEGVGPSAVAAGQQMVTAFMQATPAAQGLLKLLGSEGFQGAFARLPASVQDAVQAMIEELQFLAEQGDLNTAAVAQFGETVTEVFTLAGESITGAQDPALALTEVLDGLREVGDGVAEGQSAIAAAATEASDAQEKARVVITETTKDGETFIKITQEISEAQAEAGKASEEAASQVDDLGTGLEEAGAGAGQLGEGLDDAATGAGDLGGEISGLSSSLNDVTPAISDAVTAIDDVEGATVRAVAGLQALSSEFGMVADLSDASTQRILQNLKSILEKIKETTAAAKDLGSAVSTIGEEE